MPRTFGQNDQNVNEASLPVLGHIERTNDEEILNALDKTLDSPLRIFQSLIPDAKLNIEKNQTENGNGVGKSIPPINSVIPNFVLTTIDFQTGAITGGTVDIAFPASTVGQFRRVGLTLRSDGTLKAIFSAEAASVGALINPGTLFEASGLPIGFLDLQCTNVAGQFKTAGSSSNIIENKVGSDPRIILFSGGGSGGGSVGTVGDIVSSMLTEVQYQNQTSIDWILADGRNVAGSLYQTVTGNANVPDARGLLLRGKNNGRVDGKQNPDGDLGIGTYQGDQFASHIHSGATGGQNINTSGVNNRAVLPGNTSAAGGNETRGKNLTVNHFIKIN